MSTQCLGLATFEACSCYFFLTTLSSNLFLMEISKNFLNARCSLVRNAVEDRFEQENNVARASEYI